MQHSAQTLQLPAHICDATKYFNLAINIIMHVVIKYVLKEL